MSFKHPLAAAYIAVVVGSAVGFGYAQQGVPAKPGTPTKLPEPKPSPTPSQPGNAQPPSNNPAPTDPNPAPAPAPNDPDNPAPDPRNPNNPPHPNAPIPPGAAPIQDNRGGVAPVNPNQVGSPFLRPFALQYPEMESRFTENSTRLVRMEQRMERSHQELLKRLGEARQLSGERQNAALFELLQQMLMDQQEMHQYLVQARTTLTGDVQSPDEVAAGVQPQQRPTNPNEPAREKTISDSDNKTNVQPGNSGGPR